MSRCASADVVEPAVAPARRRSRASRAASKRMETGAVMHYIVAQALRRSRDGSRVPGCGTRPLLRRRSDPALAVLGDQPLDRVNRGLGVQAGLLHGRADDLAEGGKRL